MRVWRVLVVDDSIFMRKIITDLLTSHAQIEVIGAAVNGLDAIEQVQRLKPDVITMDVEMPGMNGLQALQKIMEIQPTPVVMLSSLTHEGAMETIKALEWGAVDFVAKPSGSLSLDLYKVKQDLLSKVIGAAQVQVKKIHTGPALQPKRIPVSSAEKQTAAAVSPVETKHQPADLFKHLIAIGTSTGGPRALQQVLGGLPADFPAPIVVVQHMPPVFTKSLSQRLDANSSITVVEASDGMLIEAGTAYIAAGGFHLKVLKQSSGRYKLSLTQESPRSGHRPSVDVLFDSLVSCKELRRHAVLMTGMGSDGAKGMLALKQSGAESLIAESQQTCVVYGMPRAAVELGATTHVLRVQHIAQTLNALVQS
ncbi:protein-glutamate methylesterase/protein-glutamine glutaminase [Paenibacillus senegalensis]|uniref:protein-glutamate methylesterase/protein-glutamine glutaminase n=1 Tax=Paenibacillus senegalensis TaxID=1465766 RepID=UPI00028962B2|nr:chemotaxis response regulator protein-glutamate methylesterase [Paenibacillus senegalensis]